MKRYVLPLALALALGLSLLGMALASAPAMHAAGLHADTSGSITGAVVNGTHGNAPVTGQVVTLQASVNHAKTQDVSTATTDASGHFSFTGLDASGASVYQLVAQYQSGEFTSGAITFDSGAAQQVTLSVYDTTTSDAALKVSVATVLFSQPNKQAGTIPVGEFISFTNSGTSAFVGSTAPANGMPMGLLRFALPDGATNLTVGQGFADTQAIQVGTGFGATATVPPGTTQFAFTFDVPYTGTDYVFHYKAEYPTDSVVVLVPTNMLTDARDFTAKPPVDALGEKYQLLQASNLKGGTQLATRLWGLPQAGEQADLDYRWLLALAGLLALLLAGLLALYLKRGNLAVALGLLPPAALAAGSVDAETTTAADDERRRRAHEAERTRLLESLLTLENRYAGGALDSASYERRRVELRGRLKALLGESSASPDAVADEQELRSEAAGRASANTAQTAEAPESPETPEATGVPAPSPAERGKRQTVGGRR